MTAIDQVLGEFIEAWNTGRRPDVEAFLARVPRTERDELARDVQMWLQIAPDPDYDEATRAQLATHPALVAALAAGRQTVAPWSTRVRVLRERAGLAIDQVAERLGAVLRIPAEPQRTLEYLTKAEHDELDERRVSRRLVAALAAVLRVDADELRPAWGTPGVAAQYLRLDDDSIDEAALRTHFDALSRAASMPAPEPLDELDRLFLGGPDA